MTRILPEIPTPAEIRQSIEDRRAEIAELKILLRVAKLRRVVSLGRRARPSARTEGADADGPDNAADAGEPGGGR